MSASFAAAIAEFATMRIAVTTEAFPERIPSPRPIMAFLPMLFMASPPSADLRPLSTFDATVAAEKDRSYSAMPAPMPAAASRPTGFVRLAGELESNAPGARSADSVFVATVAASVDRSAPAIPSPMPAAASAPTPFAASTTACRFAATVSASIDHPATSIAVPMPAVTLFWRLNVSSMSTRPMMVSKSETTPSSSVSPFLSAAMVS
ncbi:MAG: hypothetical protein GX647_12415 [Clostridiales bacterium]|nr:hypothetical protein [Clostridiales bacterium]